MVYLLASGPATLRLFRNIVCAAASAPPPRSHSNRLRFRAIDCYGRNARKYTNFFREIAIIQADIRIFERSRVKTDRNGPTSRSRRTDRRMTKGVTVPALRTALPQPVVTRNPAADHPPEASVFTHRPNSNTSPSRSLKVQLDA